MLSRLSQSIVLRSLASKRATPRRVALACVAVLSSCILQSWAGPSDSAETVYDRFAAKAEESLPYCIEFQQDSPLGPVICKTREVETSVGHYTVRMDMVGKLPGTNYSITTWENETGIWQQLGTNTLFLAFAPHTTQSPLMGFVGARPAAELGDFRLIHDTKVGQVECSVVEATLSPEAMDKEIARAIQVGRPHHAAKQVYSIGKKDSLLHALETLDDNGTKIFTVVFTNFAGVYADDLASCTPPAIPPAITVAAQPDMVSYVQHFNHPFVPAAARALAANSDRAKILRVALLGFVVCTAGTTIWLLRKQKEAA